MDTKKVKTLIEMAKEHGLSELKIESKDEKFTLKFPSANETAVLQVPANSPMMQQTPYFSGQAGIVNDSSGHSSNKSAPTTDTSLVEVTSPFVGTFYRSSSPDGDPFTKPGDKVSNGKVLCIVEAMKIMNEIEAETVGEIIEVCVENETYVEFGQVLFRIKP